MQVRRHLGALLGADAGGPLGRERLRHPQPPRAEEHHAAGKDDDHREGERLHLPECRQRTRDEHRADDHQRGADAPAPGQRDAAADQHHRGAHADADGQHDVPAAAGGNGHRGGEDARPEALAPARRDLTQHEDRVGAHRLGGRRHRDVREPVQRDADPAGDRQHDERQPDELDADAEVARDARADARQDLVLAVDPGNAAGSGCHRGRH